MARELPGPVAGEPEGADEVDVVRAAIYFLAILLVGLVVVVVMLIHQRDGYREGVAAGERNLKAMAATYDAVRGLLKEYTDSGAGEAKRNTVIWMGDRLKNAGIPVGQTKIEDWKERPQRDYNEMYVEVVVNEVPLERLVQFVWGVEKVSTKLRPITMDLRRVGGKNAPEADVWKLTVEFGYRVPKGFREGS